MGEFTMETVREIWDDKHGSRVDVGPDRDGLNLVELRCVSDDGKMGDRIVMKPEQARLVAEAIRLCADELESREDPKPKRAEPRRSPGGGSLGIIG